MKGDGISALARRVGPALGLLLLAASLVVGADLFGARTALFGSAAPPPRAAASSRSDPFSAVDTSRRTVKTSLRSFPWWQEVARLEAAKGATSFRIDEGAIQFRMGWTCERGRFVVRKQGEEKPIVDKACGGKGSAVLPGGGGGKLEIAAEGPWTARVEQQVDVPLVEPPLPAMTAPGARKVASGDFYRIDQVGKGRMTFYRLANGRYALRLSDFYVTPKIDLEIRLHPSRAPRSTRQYLAKPSKNVAPLDITAGSMNFVLPAGVDPRRYRSVVIWCPIITSAYAAATIKRT